MQSGAAALSYPQATQAKPHCKHQGQVLPFPHSPRALQGQPLWPTIYKVQEDAAVLLVGF